MSNDFYNHGSAGRTIKDGLFRRETSLVFLPDWIVPILNRNQITISDVLDYTKIKDLLPVNKKAELLAFQNTANCFFGDLSVRVACHMVQPKDEYFGKMILVGRLLEFWRESASSMEEMEELENCITLSQQTYIKEIVEKSHYSSYSGCQLSEGITVVDLTNPNQTSKHRAAPATSVYPTDCALTNAVSTTTAGLIIKAGLFGTERARLAQLARIRDIDTEEGDDDNQAAAVTAGVEREFEMLNGRLSILRSCVEIFNRYTYHEAVASGSVFREYMSTIYLLKKW
ncbi:MAG: hypothetical protein E6Q68_06180 [Polynucleobacter sp.]|nr:MAG: hypothetical protein E6Q68_06180 [Polynucleobacter sp.]